MSAAPPGARVADLTWPEVEARLRRGDGALLAVGAGAKEHGFHLPMDTDFAQAEWLVDRLVERHPVLAWPTLSYGHYPAFLDYPGSCSLSRERFAGAVAEILADLARAGAGNILILNTGISTVAPLREAIARCPPAPPVVLANIHDGPRYRATAARVARQKQGGHGDELETSIMLAIAPRRVRLDRARPWDATPPAPGPFQRRDPSAPNYAPQGINGDPTLATPEKGRGLLAAILEDLAALLQGEPR